MKAIIWRHDCAGSGPETDINELKGDWYVEHVKSLLALDEAEKDDLFKTVDYECWCEVYLCATYDGSPFDGYFELIKFTKLAD